MATPNQPHDPSKPDLEESGSVASMHEEMLRKSAAATREQKLRENGTEPVAIWIFLVCGIAMLVGGAVLGSSGRFMNYDEFIANGYKQADPPIAIETAVASADALTVYMKIGKTIYQSKCGGCHQGGGEGVAGSFPPLSGSEWVTENSGLAAAIISHGLIGPIMVKGQSWNGAMPAQGLNDPTELAGVLTYIRNSLGNSTGDVITVEMAENALKLAKEHGPKQVTSEILKAKFDKPLEGATLDPKTIISYETLEPIEAE